MKTEKIIAILALVLLAGFIISTVRQALIDKGLNPFLSLLISLAIIAILAIAVYLQQKRKK